MPKICEMAGVREYAEGDPVELWRDDASGRLVIRARNECGNNSTYVDLLDLLDWVAAGTAKRLLEDPSWPKCPPDRGSSAGN